MFSITCYYYTKNVTNDGFKKQVIEREIKKPRLILESKSFQVKKSDIPCTIYMIQLQNSQVVTHKMKISNVHNVLCITNYDKICISTMHS